MTTLFPLMVVWFVLCRRRVRWSVCAQKVCLLVVRLCRRLYVYGSVCPMRGVLACGTWCPSVCKSMCAHVTRRDSAAYLSNPSRMTSWPSALGLLRLAYCHHLAHSAQTSFHTCSSRLSHTGRDRPHVSRRTGASADRGPYTSRGGSASHTNAPPTPRAHNGDF